MDPKLEIIAQNALKFGNPMAQNKELMKSLLEPKDLGFKSDDLKACESVFDGLYAVQKNAQMSGS